MLRATFFLLLTIQLSVKINAFYGGYKSDLYPSQSSYGNRSCNKTSAKVRDKVPVYDLCYWNTIEWRQFELRTDVSSCNLHGSAGNYIVSRCIPTRVRLYNGRAYVIIDRNIGVFSSISYFELNDITEDKKCPKLECFRRCSRNQLADIATCQDDPLNYLINVRDIQFTADKIAWLLDIGAYFNGTIPIINRSPRMCKYDVSGSIANQIFCLNIPSELVNEGNQMGLNTIQVNEDGGSGKNFVYIFNSESNTIIVFSDETRQFWRLGSVFFRPKPSQSLFRFSLPYNKYYQTIEHDGIYSGAMSKYGMYFSAKASNDLYFISKKTLNERRTETCDELTYDIKAVGTYNYYGQTYGFIRHNDVLFFIQPQNNALVCANNEEIITPDTIQYLAIDTCKFAYLSSIDIYHQKPKSNEIYLLSNNFADIKAHGFNEKKKNFIISFVDLDEVEALYPQCVSYFEEYYGDQDNSDEFTYAKFLASRKEQRNYQRGESCHHEQENCRTCSCAKQYEKDFSYPK